MWCGVHMAMYVRKQLMAIMDRYELELVCRAALGPRLQSTQFVVCACIATCACEHVHEFVLCEACMASARALVPPLFVSQTSCQQQLLYRTPYCYNFTHTPCLPALSASLSMQCYKGPHTKPHCYDTIIHRPSRAVSSSMQHARTHRRDTRLW